MPTEDRSPRVPERCDRHPGSKAVARCDGCGRPMCVACSTPVRGETFGAECLTAVLGSAATVEDASGARPPDAVARLLARIAFALALLSTTLPWSRFGPGSEAFGAWSRSLRWSMVAAVAAGAGLAVTLTQRGPRLRTPRWDTVATLLGAVVVVASLLAVLFPPDFSRPWLGPWSSVVCGGLASGASFLAARATERSPTVRI